MFSLYKQRNFSALINDTFIFFRTYGKSYFKNYFIINGGLLIILLLVMYFVGDVFMETIFSSMGNPNGSEQVIEQYFLSNASLFIAAAILSGIVLLVLTLLNYSYPVVFLGLLEKKSVPQSREIFQALMGKAGKIIVFALLWLVTFLPILFITSLVALALFVIIIGIPFAILLFAAATSWMYLSFFDYLNNKSGYFDALRNGWNLLFQNFWPHVGSTVIFYVIVTVIHTIISFIPYIFGIAGYATGINEPVTSETEIYSLLGFIMLLTFILSTLFAYVLGNLLFINQGMIYYSAREENENHSLHSDIDLIGRDSE